MKTKYLILCLVLTLLLTLASSKQIPALYVFGDSLVDSGNSNNAKSLPYGLDFDGGKPTGRCTNGKTVVDYIAIHLRLPFAPPYLGLSEDQRNKITTGINYACAGSGILPDTNIMTSVSLDKQIGFFQSTVENDLPNVLNEQAKLESHLSESLFVVSTALNDHFHNKTFRGSSDFALYLQNEFSKRLQRLYKLGARKFLVNNAPPAGCFPSSAAQSTPKGKCNEEINRGISFYNKGLPDMLHELQSQLPGFTYIFSDLYNFLMEMRENGNRYGIVETWKSCCPNTIDGDDMDCHANDEPCPDRNTHLFFDSHPSQITNKIYAARCFNETTICRPYGLNL
ncbi:GDSL esterase/lipase At2g03980-like [Lotus japonicus]|uniref:GDSL esterase/lipase At2g03980-like n=1 Tax=Lotus japonicus TaxID=34305 RepID=UPI002583A9FE|nr:GDSL esterase/lipase At2g03980-like [Lotus japonicus]